MTTSAASVVTSAVVVLEGDSSSLTAKFHPDIELDKRFNYSCSLLEFSTMHNFRPRARIDERNNKLHLRVSHTFKTVLEVIEVPFGAHDMTSIFKYINEQMDAKGLNAHFELNKISNKTVIETCKSIAYDFAHSESIGELLGFDPKVIGGREVIESDHSITPDYDLNTVRINCDLVVTGSSSRNGMSYHTLFEFTPRPVAPRYKMVVQPKHLIYLPINTRRIHRINVTAVNSASGVPLDFGKATTTFRLHIKRDLPVC